MKLQELLGRVSSAHFMSVYYCKLPFASAGGCAPAAPLGSWDVLGQLLAHPGVDLIAARGGQRWEGAPPRNLSEGRALVEQGYTLGVRGAHRIHAGLAALAEDLLSDFAAPVDIHLYCTPADQPGFSWHYDAEEVFVLQTAGSKEWSLRKNTVHPWPIMETLPADMQYEREIMPLMRCQLEAGDWLYIPGGYWHATEAACESISLSVGIKAPVAIDLLDWLRTHCAQSLLWRQRLPPLGVAGAIDREELAIRFRILLDELASDVAATLRREETISAIIYAFSQLRESRPGQTRSAP